MMRVIRNGFLAFCLAMVAASQVYAADPVQLRERKPGYALAAAAMNVLYLPVRFVVTVVGAELSGLTGFFTAGNQDAAGDVASIFDGTQYLTPEHVEGVEPIRFGPPEFP